MSGKAIIYLRTSTKDQNPELQRADCVKFCKGKNLEVVEVVSEQGSAYKIERLRPLWENTIKKAKEERLDIVLWKYDRSFRNREEFYKFMKVMFEVYGVKIYSVTEPSILSFWGMLDKSYSDNPIFNELFKNILGAFWNFMIQQAGEEAEEESNKKSQRVKLSIRKDGGITKSYKGNKWGRKQIKLEKEIMDLYDKGKKMREIANEVYYWDSKRNKKFVSLGFVHKTITNVRERELRKGTVQQLVKK